MPTALLPIQPVSLPANYCYPDDPQTFVNDTIAKSWVSFTASNFTVVLRQSTIPNATERDRLWFDTDDDRVYRWDAVTGFWVSRHPEAPAPNSYARRIFVGTTTQLLTYDGGASGTVGDAAGPMWEVDTVFADNLLIGVGSTVATVLGTGGAATATLAEEHVPEHRHFTVANATAVGQPAPTGANQRSYTGGGTGQENYVDQSSATDATIARSSAWGQAAPTPVDIIPPVVGVYLVKRTARIYFVGQ